MKLHNDDWSKAFNELELRVDRIVNEVDSYLVSYFKSCFDTKSFGGVPWKPSKMNSNTMVDSGELKRSIHTISKSPTEIVIGSDLPYASIHNDGGTIRVTDKMRKFFWAKFYSTGDGAWKGMALTKKTHITIPQRQYIGYNMEMQMEIENIISNIMTGKKI